MGRRTRGPGAQELKKRIQELIDLQGGGYNSDLVADIVESALKLLTDVEHRGDVRVVQTAIRELRYAFKLFAPYADTRKVTLFGSARTQPSKPEFSRRLNVRDASRGAGDGLTGAGPASAGGHEGAAAKKFGANIRLPWNRMPIPLAKRHKLITFKYFFTRN